MINLDKYVNIGCEFVERVFREGLHLKPEDKIIVTEKVENNNIDFYVKVVYDDIVFDLDLDVVD